MVFIIFIIDIVGIKWFNCGCIDMYFGKFFKILIDSIFKYVEIFLDIFLIKMFFFSVCIWYLFLLIFFGIRGRFWNIFNFCENFLIMYFYIIFSYLILELDNFYFIGYCLKLMFFWIVFLKRWIKFCFCKIWIW